MRDSPYSQPSDFNPASDPLFYQNIKRLKIQALREQRSYKAKITLTESAKSDLHWWLSEMRKEQRQSTNPTVENQTHHWQHGDPTNRE